jgi:hypothetical protein
VTHPPVTHPPVTHPPVTHPPVNHPVTHHPNTTTPVTHSSGHTVVAAHTREPHILPHLDRDRLEHLAHRIEEHHLVPHLSSRVAVIHRTNETVNIARSSRSIHSETINRQTFVKSVVNPTSVVRVGGSSTTINNTVALAGARAKLSVGAWGAINTLLVGGRPTTVQINQLVEGLSAPGLTIVERNAISGLMESGGWLPAGIAVREEVVPGGPAAATREQVVVAADTEEKADTEVAEATEPKGVAISEVEASGPAEEAGLRAGDRILSIDDVAIRCVHDIRFAIQQGGSELKVVFVNVENGETEYLMVSPRGKQLGITLGE